MPQTMPGGLMGTPAITLIMTRPAAANDRFVSQLPAYLMRQLIVIESPLIDIVAADATVDIKAEDAIIFTSANGVRCAPRGEGQRAFCIGEVTRQAADNAGWQAVCCGGTSDALVAYLIAHPVKSPIWHAAGRHTRGRVAERLGYAGMNVTRVTVYDQALKPLTRQARDALEHASVVIVPVFSPRTARQFATECPMMAYPHVLALSQAVADPMLGLNVASFDIATRPDAKAMVQCLEKTVARISLG